MRCVSSEQNAVLSLLGQEARHASGGAVKVRCPEHDDHDPSCYLYPDGHLHCFSCSYHATALHFVRTIRFSHLSDRDGYAQAREYLGLPDYQPRQGGRATIQLWREQARKQVESQEEAAPTREERSLIATVEHYYQEDLDVSVSPLAVAYAESRGLFEHSKSVPGVGFCSGYWEESLRGDDALLAQKVGLLTKDGKARFKGRLTLAHISGISEQALWFTARAVPGLVPQVALEERKYLHLPGKTPLFGSDLIDRVHGKEKDLVVVEGPMCQVLLTKLGIPAVALLGKHLKDAHLPWFYGRRVLLCLDNPRTPAERAVLDEAVEKAHGSLLPYALSVDILTLPEGIVDPAEFIERYGVFPLD